MTQSKIGRTRKQPMSAGPKRDSVLRTLARNVYQLYEDAEQRRLFACSTSIMRDGGQTCVGAFRTSSGPEGYHALVNDERLCKNCLADVAFHLASARLRDLAGSF